MVERIGRWVIDYIREVAYGLGFFVKTLKAAIKFLRRGEAGHKVLVMQVLFTGFEALAIIGFIALALGAVIIIQGVSILPQFGQSELLYPILITAITRELGPLLCAFVLIARSGTAIATEIGNNVVNHEIEAYISSGVDPIRYLVVPRFLGILISLLILNIYFNFFGLIGSFFITRLIHPVQAAEYFGKIMFYLKTADIFSSIIKSLVFGTIISMISTYYGFKVEQSSTEVPQMAIKAVGSGFIYCILANAVITIIYYM